MGLTGQEHTQSCFDSSWGAYPPHTHSPWSICHPNLNSGVDCDAYYDAVVVGGDVAVVDDDASNYAHCDPHCDRFPWTQPVDGANSEILLQRVRAWRAQGPAAAQCMNLVGQHVFYKLTREVPSDPHR